MNVTALVVVCVCGPTHAAHHGHGHHHPSKHMHHHRGGQHGPIVGPHSAPTPRPTPPMAPTPTPTAAPPAEPGITFDSAGTSPPGAVVEIGAETSQPSTTSETEEREIDQQDKELEAEGASPTEVEEP